LVCPRCQIDDKFCKMQLNLIQLVNIAKRRHDLTNLLVISQLCLPLILEEYSRSKNLVCFLNYLDIHREYLNKITKIDNSSITLTIEKMSRFQQDFMIELDIEHRSVFLWKIQLAKFYLNNNIEFKRSEYLDLFKKLMNKEGFDDVKLELYGMSSQYGEEIFFKQINESKLEKPEKLKYFSLRFHHWVRVRNFDESEKWLLKFEEGCMNYDFSFYESDIVFHKVWFLYWKSQFNKALELLEQLDEAVKQMSDTFYFLESLLLLKLGKYDEAETVYDGRSIVDTNDDSILSFVKFMKCDFSGVKKLLEKWKVVNEINNILDYVCLYEMKWNDFNRKKNSSSFNQNEDFIKSLKECVEMKKIIVKMYDDFFLHSYRLTF